MQTQTSVDLRKFEPEYHGPLEERGFQETTPSQLFAGEERFLKGAALRKRCDLWQAAAPILDRLLESGEHVLYAAQAVQKPSVFQALSLGRLAYMYHQVLLVFTDRRVIEILLNQKAKAPDTRIRSFPLSRVSKLSLRFLSVTLVPVEGKKGAWTVSGGDRKLLKLLLPRIQEHLHPESASPEEIIPKWHCPNCLAVSTPNPKNCEACGTLFRSSRLASVLSLAFPGAGLLYGGHPVLATFDFLGELVVFGFIAVMLATAGTDTASVLGFAGMGAFALFLTKFESIHLGHILVSRSRPEDPERRARWKKFTGVGGALSVVAIAGALALSGTLGAVQKNDLHFEHAQWQGSRDPSEWVFFAEDPTLRSQWTHEDGWLVSIFAYPLNSLQTLESFKEEFLQEMDRQNLTNVVEDEALPSTVKGFRHLGDLLMGEDDVKLTAIYYFVYGPDESEIHQLLTVVEAQEADAVESDLRDLLAEVQWIPAAEPDRTMASTEARPANEVPAGR
ncbi:MAG: zinc ribbon domain-containing protein [Acidobacteriota bacterium]